MYKESEFIRLEDENTSTPYTRFSAIFNKQNLDARAYIPDVLLYEVVFGENTDSDS